MILLEKDYKGGYMVCAHPDQPDAHDDFCDSAALAVWGAQHPAELMEVQEYDSNEFAKA